MTAAVSRRKLGEAARRGIEKAFKQYHQMSGDALDSAREYFVVCKIADEVCKQVKGKARIRMEQPVRKTLKEAGSPPGKFKVLRGNRRFDLVFYWKSGKESPRAAIEVKHPVIGDSTILDPDAERLCRALGKPGAEGSGLQFGMLAFYASSRPKSSDPKAMLEDRLLRLKESIKSVAERCNCRPHFDFGKMHIEDGGRAWRACCIRLFRN